MSHEKLIAAILMTIADIDDEFISADPLFQLGRIRNFDFIETAAAASILQGFYTGIENILLFLYKSLDGIIPQTPSWHRDLLDGASKNTLNHSAIFTPATQNLLVTYLNFRHVVRHGYTRRLRSDRTRDLFLAVPLVWEAVRRDLELFIDKLRKDTT